MSYTFNFQVRNKPIEPPKKPEKVPFFLPSVPSLSGEILFKPSTTANAENAKTDDVENNASKFDMAPSQFLQLLQSSAERKNCEYANSLYLFTNVVCHRVWLNGPFHV